MKIFRTALCLACCVLGTACASKTPDLQPTFTADSSTRWQAMLDHTPPPAPAVLNGSLRFGPANDTRRVTYVLWSNGKDPIRLDVQAGVGAVVAKVHVEDGMVLVYLPQDQKAYVGTDAPAKALKALGVPLPLSLGELHYFLLGRYQDALGRPSILSSRPASAEAKSQNIIYVITNAQGESEIEISPNGLPVRWSTKRWSVNMTYDANNLPNRMDGRMEASMNRPEQRFVLLIKERQQPPKPFELFDLNFQLPDDTPTYALDE